MWILGLKWLKGRLSTVGSRNLHQHKQGIAIYMYTQDTEELFVTLVVDCS